MLQVTAYMPFLNYDVLCASYTSYSVFAFLHSQTWAMREKILGSFTQVEVLVPHCKSQYKENIKVKVVSMVAKVQVLIAEKVCYGSYITIPYII